MHAALAACQYRDVRAVRGRRLLLAAVVVVLGLGVAALVTWLAPELFGPFGSAATGSSVDATVYRMAACDDADPHDTVQFTVHGKPQRARLDGCGNAPGEHLQVVIPPRVDASTLVRLSAAGSGPLPGAYRRVGFGLLAASCIAGAGIVLVLRRHLPGHRPEPA